MVAALTLLGGSRRLLDIGHAQTTRPRNQINALCHEESEPATAGSVSHPN